MTYTNENGNEKQYQTQVKSSLSTKFGGVLYTNISGYNAESTNIDTIEANIEGTLDIKSQAKQATVNQSFINNYDNEIGEINIVGSVQGENSTIQGISASGEDVKIYYSEEENAKEESNTWQEEATANAKSYKIEKTGALAKTEKIDIKFNLSIPANIQAGEEIVQQTEANYVYNKQKLNTVTKIALEAPTVKISETNGVKTEISAESGRQALQDGDEVYEGQAIRYSVKVTNNTGAALNNFQLTAEHTNAVYYVILQEDARDPEVGKGYTEGQDPIMERTVKDETAENITKNQSVIQNGETIVLKYDISPKQKNGTEISGNIKIKADELAEQTLPTITNKIKSAEVSINQVNQLDEKVNLTEGIVFPVNFVITNYTDKELKDVLVTINTTEELEISGPNYEQLDGDFESIEKEIDIGDGNKIIVESISRTEVTLKISKIAKKDKLPILWAFYTATSEYLKTAAVSRVGTITSSITYNNITYYSNIIERTIERVTPILTATQSVEIQHQDEESTDDNYIYVGDKLIYTTEIENTDTQLGTEGDIYHMVTLYNGNIKKAYIEDEDGKISNADLVDTGFAMGHFTLQPGEKIEYVAEVDVWENPDADVNYEEFLESTMEMEWNNCGSLTLAPITLQMEGETGEEPDDVEELPDDGREPEQEESNKQNKPTNGNTQEPSQNREGTYSISGKAWLDSNKNGIRENYEKGIPSFEVKLLDAENGQTVSSSVTNDEGDYIFNNIEKGNYITIFMYNSSKYSITGYHKDGISDSENSDVIQRTINNVIVAATDNITIQDANVYNLDAGFISKDTFDLKIDKSITRVAVKNAEGTKITDFNKSKLAKVDINAKQLANSTVTVEYLFEITNEGNISGYATDIIDYMPNDLIFNKEQNAGWYVNEQDKNLHNISLEKEIIEPGETKTLTLVLTKQMTETSTGSSANIAEIGGETNELSEKDVDSTPNNRKDGEDDISTAELLISVKTGLVVYVSAIAMLIILAGAAFIIYKKRKEK